jgi:hypothetical protein
MSKQTTKRTQQLSFEEFETKYKSLFAEDDFFAGPATATDINKVLNPYDRSNTTLSRRASGYVPPVRPSGQLISELKEWWLVRALNAAKKENCPEAFTGLLQHLLFRLRVLPPKGVFIPCPGTPGAPHKKETLQIYSTWVAIGKPSLTTQKLAYRIYGAVFTKALSKERKRMVDQCRQSVERHKRRLNLPKNIS